MIDEMPKKYFYIDEYQINSFYEQIFGKLAIENNKESGKKKTGEAILSVKLAKLFKFLSPVEPSVQGSYGIESNLIEMEKNVIGSIGRLSRIIEILEVKKAKYYFKDINLAIDYCNTNNKAFINIQNKFDVIPYMLPGKNPINEINKSKAIQFEYNTIDNYDSSDDYFKNNKVKITMVASLNKMISNNEYFGGTSHEAAYFRSSNGKQIRLEVIGEIFKSYEFYQIKPIALAY